MTVKELKELIKDFNDEVEVKVWLKNKVGGLNTFYPSGEIYTARDFKVVFLYIE